MITNFQLSHKTKRPDCCDFECCGNKFGRIERSVHAHVHGSVNRIVKTRRYAKHVERQLVQKEITNQLVEVLLDIDDFNREMMHFEMDELGY